jgi:geranylgeranyl diphosphate synthase type I
MDIYGQIAGYFSKLPGSDAWDEMAALFLRLASHKPRHWLLPVKACEAVGGTPEGAVPAAVAIASSHISIILVDDMLDSDPRGEYQRIGAPAAANLACAFQAASLEAIVRSERESLVLLLALASFNRMYLMTALGQYLDVQCPADEEAYWRIVQTKSSPFFGVALHIGALLGGASVETAGRLKEFGNVYGEMVQIHDDLSDTLAVPANPDWTQGRLPLPILFAQTVEHAERARFLELRQEIADESALLEAQEILIRCGAVSYCVDQILRRYRSSQDILAATSLPRRDVLDALLEEVVAPVWRLFEAIGETPVSSIPEGPGNEG